MGRLTLAGCLRLYSPVLVLTLWTLLRIPLHVDRSVGTVFIGVMAVSLLLHTRELVRLYRHGNRHGDR